MASRLNDLPNIGKTIEKRLRQIGIHTPRDLARIGAVEAWRRIRSENPGKTVPVCYYLYSLEGALRGVHWDDLPPSVKKRLREQAQADDAAG